MNLSPISFLYIDSVRSEEGEKSKKSTNSEYCLHLKKFNSLKKNPSAGAYTPCQNASMIEILYVFVVSVRYILTIQRVLYLA